jgi:protein-tyrosine phosphatase
MNDRVLPLEGVHNFRSFGGYETADGARLRDGLWRSGQFSRATPADLDAMDALGVRVVADLRRPRERELEPSHWPERPGVQVLASDHAGAAEPPHLVFLRESDLTFESIHGFMADTYRRLPFDEGNKWVFERGFRALADAEDDHGFIVHCAAGKDRTGMFCAFLKWELGVHPDAVIDDYLMTNTAVDYDRILPGFQKRIKDQLGKDVGHAELKAFMGVHEDYMAAAMEAVGDPKAYLREELGLEPDVLERLETRLKR